MEVRITKEMFAACQDILEDTPFDFNENEVKFHDNTELNLSYHTEGALTKLSDELEKHKDIRGVKTLIRDIASWLRATKTKSGTVRARNCAQAEGLMIEYIRKNDRRHIYERIQDAAEGVMVPYFVSRVEHTTQYDRDYKVTYHFLEIDGLYEEFGIRKKAKWVWSAKDIVGLTPAQILSQESIFLETEELRADYEIWRDDWLEIKDQIGRQYMAVGNADDGGIDGNEDDDDDDYRSWKKDNNVKLDQHGESAKVVIDVFQEKEKTNTQKSGRQEGCYFWNSIDKKRVTSDDGPTWDPDDDENKEFKPEVPIHSYVVVFDLLRHKRLKLHVGNMRPYKFQEDIQSKLVLPKSHSQIIEILLASRKTEFKDIIKGKSGGMIVLCEGPAGTGKTLTAEVYAESLGKALYTVQCSQLGTDPEKLEKSLMKVLTRGKRWGAVMLLDEADVYVHKRGTDLIQNAIVGVFLRVLEYYAGTLFLTTNLVHSVDDAILSRCVARIPFGPPAPEDQARIWAIIADQNKVELDEPEIKKIVKLHPHLSGRDVKNLLKLAMAVAQKRDSQITADLITEVKVFKPTYDGGE